MNKFSKQVTLGGNGGPYKSFNRDYRLVKEDTRVIIVGTITSPQGRGANKDFYYMSPYNPMYRIIDNYFESITIEENGKLDHWPVNFFDQAEKDLNVLLGI